MKKEKSHTQHTSLAIIGSGPAGYTAGIYSARALLSPVIFAGIKSGGQLMYTTDIENFPGFPNAVMGAQLMSDMRQQAQHFGAKVVDQFVSAVDFAQRPFRLWTQMPQGVSVDIFESGTSEQILELTKEIKKNTPDFTADAVIIASGAVSKMIGAKNEKLFLGKGVSTCAVCDAAFYREKDTFVVGGGDSAMEDALALTKFAKSVTLVHRRDSFRASKIMQERVLSNPKVKVMWNSQVVELKGEDLLKEIVIRQDGKDQLYPADGLFVAIGHRPMSHLFADQVKLDSHGYVLTRSSFTQLGLDLAGSAIDKEGKVAYPTMTDVEGVFASGDVVDVRFKQAITASGSGCMASLDAERWLEANNH